MTDLRSMARALGGEVSGHAILCPGPGHSPCDRSLSVMPSPSAPDGFVVWSHSGDDPLASKDYVRQRLGVPAERSIRRDRGDRCSTPALADRTARVLDLWNEARTPIGSPVERYLAGRGLALPDDAREVIRFHPSCPFAGTRTRAMVALVRDIVTNAPVAIHRTALSFEGCKAVVNGHDRLALGPTRGGAVKLTADEAVTRCLGVGEGIESTLSLQQLPEFGPSPVWALLNAGGIAALPVLPGIESLWIAVDHDPAGISAADLTSHRWRRAGREVFLVKAVAERAEWGQGFKDMSPAIDALERLAVEGRLRHGMHPVLTWCAGNAKTVADPAGNRKFDKKRSTGRIDGLQALAMALGAANRHEAEPDWSPMMEVV